MKITDFLDVVGGSCLVLFSFAIWPPLSLLTFGSLCLVASWRASS